MVSEPVANCVRALMAVRLITSSCKRGLSKHAVIGFAVSGQHDYAPWFPLQLHPAAHVPRLHRQHHLLNVADPEPAVGVARTDLLGRPLWQLALTAEWRRLYGVYNLSISRPMRALSM
jgi:hypothetical protein